MFPTLVSLLSIMEAYLLDQAPPALPQGGTEGGISDEELWVRLSTPDGDVLGGMDFAEAVQNDPRRIAALIEQRVMADFYKALAYVTNRSEGAIRHSWLLGYAALRQDRGRVDAQGIRDLWLSMRAQESVDRQGQMEVQPPNYLRLLDAGLAMARPGSPAEQFWRHLDGNQTDVRRLFAESVEIAERAALCSPEEADAEAWRQVGSVLTDLREGLDDRRARFIANPPAARPRRHEIVGGLGEPDDRFAGVVDCGVFGSYGRSDNANARTKRIIQAQHAANARAYASRS
jgi:hypothetical protein